MEIKEYGDVLPTKVKNRHYDWDPFWENAHLPFRTLVRLAFLWSFDVPNKTTMAFTGLAKNTVIQWFQYFRDVCSHHLLQNPIMIGGPSVVVEVDESVIAKRKYQRGHLIPERWVFGGVCPDTHEGFLFFVPSRDAATLLPIIQQHVRPGSIIHTDGWLHTMGLQASMSSHLTSTKL